MAACWFDNCNATSRISYWWSDIWQLVRGHISLWWQCTSPREISIKVDMTDLWNDIALVYYICRFVPTNFLYARHSYGVVSIHQLWWVKVWWIHVCMSTKRYIFDTNHMHNHDLFQLRLNRTIQTNLYWLYICYSDMKYIPIQKLNYIGLLRDFYIRCVSISI